MKIQVIVHGRFPERGALISNHLSYLDIVVYAGLHRCVFVSKAEVVTWPVVGWMTTMSGTVYVERGRGGSVSRASQSMRAAMSEGLPVVFFPEGTTSSGDGVLRFHGGLLGEVLADGEPVTAAFIRYRIAPDNKNATVRDNLHFWGDTPMVPHILGFLGLRGVIAEVVFASSPIAFSTPELTRKQAATEARQNVCALGRVDEGVVARE